MRRILAGVVLGTATLLSGGAMPAIASSDDITISPSSLPHAQLGAQYDVQLVAQLPSGVDLPRQAIIFDVTQGAPPEGMYVDPGGLIEGGPRLPGSSTFTVTAHDYNHEHTGSATYTITADVPADPGQLAGWIPSLPSTLLAHSGCVGVLYTQLVNGRVVGCF